MTRAIRRKITDALRACLAECQDQDTGTYRNRRAAEMVRERYPELFQEMLVALGLRMLTVMARSMGKKQMGHGEQQFLFPPEEIAYLGLPASISLPDGTCAKVYRATRRQVREHKESFWHQIKADRAEYEKIRQLDALCSRVVPKEQEDEPIGPILDAYGEQQRMRQNQQEAA